MSAQDVMLGAQVLRLRELKAQVAGLKAENAALRDELGALRAHFDQALIAAQDLGALPEGGVLEVWDGWNLILGADRVANDRSGLLTLAREHLAAHPLDRVWIVLDGHDERVRNEGRLRVSYTGGSGEHRADRLIVDFVRMAAYVGHANRVRVRTRDKAFARSVLGVAGGPCAGRRSAL